jgi:riboflavin kinase/FMN adenylyltransferase
VITIGNFDGVHLGHQEIFRRVKRKARSKNGKAVVFTFEPHPLKLLRPEKCPPLITPYAKRIRLIQHFGMNAVVVAKFTREFAALSPEAFFDILRDIFNVKAIYIGYDFSFGRDRKGSVEKLKSFGKRNSVEIEVVEPIMLHGMPVSSTKIRHLVAEGDMPSAQEFLGRYFFLSGNVVKGHKRGQRFGYPTANIETGHELFPPRGVYATFLYFQGKRYRAATNLGVNPTFNNGAMSIESYILDFEGSLYGEEVSVSFVQKIRDELCFSTVDALVHQIKEDVKKVEEILKHEEQVTSQETPEG